MTALEIFDIVVKSLTFVSIAIATLSLWLNSRYTKRQWNFNAFTHYTKRYDDIMGEFPGQDYTLRFDLEHQIPSNNEVRLAVLRYLNMTSEEFYLQRDKYLDDKVWQIWLPEIKRTLQSPLFQREWQNLKGEFKTYEEFSDFVEQVQSEMVLLNPPRQARRRRHIRIFDRGPGN
jgi:hypothetical protein